MKYYSCDNPSCEVKGTEPKVVLKGITGTSGGILLPEQCQEKHFCEPKCFWEWADKYHSKSKCPEMHTGPSIPPIPPYIYPGKLYKADKDGFVQQTEKMEPEKMDKSPEIHLRVEYITLPFVRIKPYKPGRDCFDTSQWPNEPCGEVVIPVVVTADMTKDDITLAAINFRNILIDEWIKLGNCAT